MCEQALMLCKVPGDVAGRRYKPEAIVSQPCYGLQSLLGLQSVAGQSTVDRLRSAAKGREAFQRKGRTCWRQDAEAGVKTATDESSLAWVHVRR